MEPKKIKRLSDAELQWIKATFADNEQGLITLRKILLQTAELDNTPVGYYRDSWSGIDLRGLSETDKLLAVAAHQMNLSQIESALFQIKNMAGEKTESFEQMMKRLEKNSAK